MVKLVWWGTSCASSAATMGIYLGPGAADYVKFPDGTHTKLIENTVYPYRGSKYYLYQMGGRSRIEPNFLNI